MTQLLGIFADPVAHSISPAMHNLAFSALGLDFSYLPFQISKEQLPKAIESIKALNMRGVNLSMPHKEAAVSYLDELSAAARLAGAVNTIVNDNGKLVGHLTDGTGFLKALADEGVYIKGKDIVLLGAGGAAKAVAIQAALDGAKGIAIFNRSIEKAEALAKIINGQTQCHAAAHLLDHKILRQKVASANLLINGTGVGMKPYEEKSLIEEPDVFHKGLVVADMIYVPAATKLLELANSVGCQIINGKGMLLHQGAAAFELWTGQPFPLDVVREALFND